MSTANPVSYANPMRCPLCEQENQCAVAAGSEPSRCWCMTTKIDEQAKRRAASSGTEKRCLCQQCGCPISK
ncbi:cysteine-rich CWC family protein [Zhongshania aliphaticivorans]|uniref:cysteine-rich CWC family protein n=1 Tax=Zhongshania aliphaticivorans TaxID=1470434 RepID=UPI00132FE579